MIRALSRWWRMRRRRRTCWHHQLGGPAGPGDLGTPAVSFVTGDLIDLGRRKLFRCASCGKVEIV